MKLKISDRIALSQILPDKDDYINLCYRRDVMKKTEFSSKELEQFNIKTITQGDKVFTTWDKNEEEVDIELKAGEITYVMSKLKELSDKKELISLQLGIYEMFSKL